MAASVADAATGSSSMVNDVKTIFSGNASLLDKVLAGADLLMNVVMDVTSVVGLGEGLKAAYIGMKAGAHLVEDAAVHAGVDAAEHVGEHEAEDTAEHAAADAAEGAADSAGDVCSLSFAPQTLVALAGGGEQPIASLKVGQAVLAYNPSTHASTPQAIQAVSIHHDDNLLDVTLRVTGTGGTTSATSATSATTTHTSRASGHAENATTTRNETIHTTATHPWLTADEGWLPAGFLRIGQPVMQTDGATAVVVSVRSVVGGAAMWDLTVANVHTFAVGDGQFVVHNCASTDKLQPGPKAEKSIPARGSGRDFTAEERAQIDEIGYDTGCHSCGTRDPGTKSGHFILDHQPPNELNPMGNPQRLYPQCLACSLSQGGQVRLFQRVLGWFMIS